MRRLLLALLSSAAFLALVPLASRSAEAAPRAAVPRETVVLALYGLT